MNLLLEIGTEDLPARFIPAALQQLRQNTGSILKENRIVFSAIRTCGTPRRLTVIAEGVPERQDDSIKEIFGPSRKAAFDENGKPTKAAIGFAHSQGISVESLAIKKKEKGEYVAAVIEERGMSVNKILPDILKRIIFSLHLPKSMRWDYGNIRFVRPIRWLLALFDKDIISFEIDGIKSSNITRGHRFLSPAAFQIKEISGYKKLLANNYVVVDQDERRKIIADRMETLLSTFGERPMEDEELIETVVNLVEYPVPVLANFSENYLTLPQELLITVMKGHQKYFAVQDEEGRIKNHFVVVSNTSEENSGTVRAGAERVIKARFEDARFYFEEDRKKPLWQKVEALKYVTFHERLGSLYEKIERVTDVAVFIGTKTGFCEPLRESPSDFLNKALYEKEKNSSNRKIANKWMLGRAGMLCKADLVTGVVREFPELQGIMGKYYALFDGEDAEVAEALQGHYMPLHSKGKLPQTQTGAIVSIADKIDNIASFFSIGLIPTGSEDPFALRRQALGIMAIIMERDYEISLRGLTERALENLAQIKGSIGAEENILKFFQGRLETMFSDMGYSQDLVQSILFLSVDTRLSDIKERIDAIKKFKETGDYADFLTAVKRVNNIIPERVKDEVNEELLIEEHERILKREIDSAKSKLAELLRGRDYSGAIKILSSLTGHINEFFDHVLVMDKREEIKQNRLALLKEVWRIVLTVADFSKLSAELDA